MSKLTDAKLDLSKEKQRAQFSWDKGKSARRVKALGAHVALGEWDRPAPGDTLVRYQGKSSHNVASETLSKPACGGWRYSRSDLRSARWKRFGHGWYYSTTRKTICVVPEQQLPPPALGAWHSRPALSRLSSPLSFTGICLPCNYRPRLTSPTIKTSGAFQGMMNGSVSSQEANDVLLFSWNAGHLSRELSHDD